MPEEINRIVTDSLCNYFFTTSVQASENLLKNGVSSNKIYFVGNTMIDTLLQHYDNARKPHFWEGYELMKKGYFLITLHDHPMLMIHISYPLFLQPLKLPVRDTPFYFRYIREQGK